MRSGLQITVLVFACLPVRAHAQTPPLDEQRHDRIASENPDGPKGDLQIVTEESPDASDVDIAGECSTIGCNTFDVQHPLPVQSVDCGFWTAVASDLQNGNWSLYEVQEGRLYQWSICETNGGFANFAGRLSLWNEAGTVRFCHTEDLCASNPRIRWTAQATQTVRVLVSQSDCGNDPGTSAKLVWRCLAPPDIAVDATELSFSCGAKPTASTGQSSPGLETRGLLIGSDSRQFEEAILQTQAKGGKLLVRVADKVAWFALPRGYVAPTADHALLSSVLMAEHMARETHDSLHRAMGHAFVDALGGGVHFGAVATEPPLIDDALDPPAISQSEYRGHLNRLALVEPALQMDRMNIAVETSSQEMAGTVTVALVFVESNGSIDPDKQTWTDADEAATVAGVASGLAWWAEKAQDRGVTLSFRVVIIPHTDPRAQQGYEPILHASSEESLWIRAIMANMGLAGEPYAAVTAFNTMQESMHRSDHAYTAFFSYNPAPGPVQFTDGYAAWAFLGGPYTSLLFRTFGWSTSQAFAHETGHIFRACDEYHLEGYGGCQNCGPCAQGVENGNCQLCNPYSVPCMMRANEDGLCSFTARQLGWPVSQEQCFDIYNDGNQTLTIASIDHPSWVEISPALPITIFGGESRHLCSSVHCGSCQVGPLVGSLTFFTNDPDEAPVVPIHVECACSAARVACRCAGGEFHCSVLFPDPSRNGEAITIEIDGVPQRGRVHKNSAQFTGSIGDGSHLAVMVDPDCPNVSEDFSCGPP